MSDKHYLGRVAPQPGTPMHTFSVLHIGVDFVSTY